jgi:hypothetical protein
MGFPQIADVVAKLPPRYEPLCLSFYREVRSTADGAVVIGSDEGTQLHVDLLSARVGSVDPETGRTRRLVNSTVDQLAAAIGAYDEYVTLVRDANNDNAHRLVEELRRRLAAIDPAATADPDTWWSLVLEQAEHGLI